MTRTMRLDDLLSSWMEAEATALAPTDLGGRIVEGTRGRRPRARWLATIHELPVALGGPRLLAGPLGRVAWVVLVLVATLIVTLTVIVGARLFEQRQVVTTIAPDPLLERDLHQALLLADGRVLVVGGSNGYGPAADAALVDPWTGDVEPVPMVQPRTWGMTATPLDDGRILVAGGYVRVDGDDDSQTTRAEVFDPVSESFAQVGPMTYPRGAALVLKVFVPLAVPLPDGRVLIVGGTTGQMAGFAYPRPGEIFDPATLTFSPTPPLPCVGAPSTGDLGQEVRTADLLPDGRILLSCERWNHPRPSWGRSSRVGPLSDPQGDPAEPEQRFFAFDLDTGASEPLDLDVGLVARTLRLADGSLLLWVDAGRDHLANGEKVGRYSLMRLDLASLTLDDLGAEVTSGAAVEVLDSGHVAVAGGHEPGTGSPTDSVRLVDPCSGDVAAASTSIETRVGGAIAQLDATHLLLVGGQLGQDPDMHEPAASEIVTLPEVPPPACTG